MTWQPAPILFPDVELALTGRIREALTGRGESYAQDVFVGNTVPTPRRNRMVIVRRDGGQALEMRDNARVSLRVWAGTEQDATDLARLVAALMWSFPDGAPILRVEHQSGPTPIADESKQSLRYLVFEVATRGEAVA